MRKTTLLLCFFMLIHTPGLFAEDPAVDISLYQEVSQDQDKKKREAAVVELSGIKSLEAAKALALFFNDKKYDIKKKAVRAVIDLALPETLDIILLLQNDKEEEIRDLALSGIKSINDDRVINAYLAALDDKEEEIRKKALEYSSFSGKKAMPVAVKALRDKKFEIRKEAVKMIAAQNDSESIKELAAVFFDPNRELRHQAIIDAGVSGQVFFIGRLSDVLGGKNMEDKILAINSLASIGTEEAAGAITRALEDKGVLIRKISVIALGNLGYFSTTEKLAERLSSEKDKKIKAEILRALGSIGDKRAVPFIEKDMLKTDAGDWNNYINSVAVIINKNKTFMQSGEQKAIKDQYEKQLAQIKKAYEESLAKVNAETAGKEELSQKSRKEISLSLIKEIEHLYSINEKKTAREFATFGSNIFAEETKYAEFRMKIEKELKEEENRRAQAEAAAKKENEEKARLLKAQKMQEELKSAEKAQTGTTIPAKKKSAAKKTPAKKESAPK